MNKNLIIPISLLVVTIIGAGNILLSPILIGDFNTMLYIWFIFDVLVFAPAILYFLFNRHNFNKYILSSLIVPPIMILIQLIFLGGLTEVGIFIFLMDLYVFLTYPFLAGYLLKN